MVRSRMRFYRPNLVFVSGVNVTDVDEPMVFLAGVSFFDVTLRTHPLNLYTSHTSVSQRHPVHDWFPPELSNIDPDGLR